MSDTDTIEVQPRPCWIAGHTEQAEHTLTVHHPYDGTAVAEVAVPDADQVERAVAAAASAFRSFAASPAHVRATALSRIAELLTERADEVAETITAENGKPLMWADVEVERAVATFRFAAEESRRLVGDLQRLDTDADGENRLAVVRRRARGPVLAIAPFNFPLNLVARKVAPAIAVGAPVIVKPASATPLTALLLGEILAEAGLPDGAFSVLPVAGASMRSLVTDPRLPVISFTGSTPVGWSIADAAPRKQIVLELGGNSAAIVCPDWVSDADLEHAAARIALFGNYQAGQSCIAVQRVIVHRDMAQRFVPRLVSAVRGLRTGDPHDPEVEVGPLIDEAAATRVEKWIGEAVSAGAELLTGGTREGTSIRPTVLANVPDDSSVVRQEVFGPVLVVSVVDSVAAAFEQANTTDHGLQAGVFTHDVTTAFQAAATIDVAGVVMGDVPSYRGNGREGVRSSMLEYTQDQVLVLTNVAL